MSRAVAVLLVVACAHAPPRATVLGGKRVGLGELVGDSEVKAVLKDAIAESFELDSANPQLHLHVDATMSGFDEPVNVLGQGVSARQPNMPVQYRRVQTMRATLRLVEDATGEVLATGVYELMEKGPERPREARATDELGIILARRVVRAFIEEHKL